MSIRELTLDKVEKEFMAWRDNKKGKPKIPEILCKQVKMLIKSHGPTKVLRRLGLSWQQAKVKGLLSCATVSTKNIKRTPLSPFIKIPQPLPKLHERVAKLTLQRGDTQLSLNDPSNEQLQLLINTLWR